MPSTPSPTARFALPWFLDALRWTRGLSPAGDRDTIELVRLDVEDDLSELLAGGVPRREAYRRVWRRVKVECGFYWPRAGAWWKSRVKARWNRVRQTGRRLAKPALGVGLAGVVLLSAKWLWFDLAALREFGEVRRELVEATDRLDQAQSSLEQAAYQDTTTTTGTGVPVATQAILRRLDEIRASFGQAQHDYPGKFYLDGLIGLIDEGLAEYWEARGDAEKAKGYWTSALQSYRRGAERGDPYALLHLGDWHCNRGDLEVGVVFLRRAQERWPLLLLPSDKDPGHAAATLHWALLELWKTDRNPQLAVEARQLEEVAIRDARDAKTTKPLTYQILYNAACLRVRMIEAGALDPVEGIHAVELLRLAFDRAGASASMVASGLLSDPDLDGLRGLPAYRQLAARASAYLETLGPK